MDLLSQLFLQVKVVTDPEKFVVRVDVIISGFRAQGGESTQTKREPVGATSGLLGTSRRYWPILGCLGSLVHWTVEFDGKP